MKYLKLIMPSKQESDNKTTSVKYNFARNQIQHAPNFFLISGDRKINFVLTNVTDNNVVHIYSNNDPKCVVVDIIAGLKIN